jgi:hypothetical protein
LHHLIIDTCVWVDLAVSEFSLVAKLARLIDDGKARIVIPDLVRTEWGRCKKKIETQIVDEVVSNRRFAMKFVCFMDEIESTDLSAKISFTDPTSMGRRIAARRIEVIEKILSSTATTQVAISARAKTLAVNHALEKKAPFRLRNSMADALIFLTAVEWVNHNMPNGQFLSVAIPKTSPTKSAMKATCHSKKGLHQICSRLSKTTE